jgi:PAS domain S-box-containing protein
VIKDKDLMPSETIQNTNIMPAFLQGGGEMGALMRAYDWENHPLGKPEGWPETLKTTVRILLNSAFPMFLWWGKELYMFHNDAYLPALGNKHPKALGSSAHVMWAEIWDTVGVVAEDILKTGSQFYAEELYLVLERKGFPEETYWTFSYSPAFDDQGEVNGVFCACTEVTKTVLNQRRLRTMKDISDATAHILTLEQACQTASEILSRNFRDIPFNLIYLFNAEGTECRLVGKAGDITADAAPEFLELNSNANNSPLHALLNTRQPVLIDHLTDNQTMAIVPGFSVPAKAVVLPIFRPGQDEIIGLCISGISASLKYDADYIGFHQLMIGQFATFITSVQAREENLRQQEYLKEIFQQAPVAITILRGPEHIIDLANTNICEIWGRRQEEVLGRTVLEALPEVADQGIIELLDGVYNTGVPFVANELPVSFDRDGKLEEVYLNFVYHPLRNPAGQITGIIAVAIDINEQVEDRRRIEEMNQELLGINADLDNFVYSASHDLKAPISNIEGLMRALVDYLPAEVMQSETEIPRVLNLIQNSVDRFKRAIADLTEVAKIQRDSTEDIVKLSLKDIVEDVKLDFERLIREKEATIDVQVNENAVVEFSAKNARSIIYNLLSNALKYSSPDRKPLIKITIEANPDFTVLCVADNGLGLNPADESKIFGMFKRLHDHVEGSGIGLYIVKRILENAGGRIELDSEPGKGSTFKVYFKRL